MKVSWRRPQQFCARPVPCKPCMLACRPDVRARAAAAAPATTDNMGDVMWTKSYYPKLSDTKKVEKDWYIIDAEGQKLGRLACLVSKYIRGKHAPTFTPSMDMGAFVVVINADKVIVTGRKTDDKLYRRHVNGLPGSMKIETFRQLQQRFPEKIIEKAVWGMLPKGRLGRRIKLNLKVFKGSEHPHVAQTPIDITDKIDRTDA